MIKTEQAIVRGHEILDKYGIFWDIEITDARDTLAVTDHNKETIELSKRFVLLASQDQFEGIMKHEIAHILAGSGRGHGDEFVQVCEDLGVDEVYSCDNYPIHIKKYLYTCNNCGAKCSSEEKKEMSCLSCLQEGLLVDLEVRNNKIEECQW